jgi:P27 family predicted phage terminase small subunit
VPTPRIPTAIKRLNGNPGHQPLSANEPQPEVGEPEMPSDLTEDQREIWAGLVPILSSMRVLTEADGMMLANLCRNEALLQQARREYEQACQRARAEGRSALLIVQKGMAIENPILRIIRHLMEEQKALLQEFGMCPAARAKLRTEPKRDRGRPSNIERMLMAGDDAAVQ